MIVRHIFTVVITLLFLAGCGEEAVQDVSQSDEQFRKELQGNLIKAKPGDVIEIPEGTFNIDRSLTLNVDGVTLRGAGMDKSVLSFRNQKAGAEGILVTASDFTIEDLAIEDTKGDALKINKGKNIVIRRVRNSPRITSGFPLRP